MNARPSDCYSFHPFPKLLKHGIARLHNQKQNTRQLVSKAEATTTLHNYSDAQLESDH